ncbi:MAG: hypothetical protein OJF50_004723 [Nitrospira sp.]|nr:hypothetical protein [Nitrospira sp.]
MWLNGQNVCDRAGICPVEDLDRTWGLMIDPSTHNSDKLSGRIADST